MACVKHYALNSMENARFSVDVSVDEATLHDVYLPHFKRVADEGVAAVMGAYNAVNGEWCGQSSYLLTTVLRDMWDWGGITVSDFIWGMRDGAKALNAGMDLEEPFRQQRAEHLRGQLEEGETSWSMVDTRAPGSWPPSCARTPPGSRTTRRSTPWPTRKPGPWLAPWPPGPSSSSRTCRSGGHRSSPSIPTPSGPSPSSDAWPPRPTWATTVRLTCALLPSPQRSTASRGLPGEPDRPRGIG